MTYSKNERRYREMKKKLMGVLLAIILVGSFMFPAVVGATNPTVTITVSAQLISITNSQDTWTMGAVGEGGAAVKWGSSDTHSQINNTGNVPVDIQIQGTNATLEGYDWTLGSAAGDKIYSLYANTEANPTTYDIEVKYTGYNNLTTNLATATLYNWSMEFTPPTVFDPADPGTDKSITITLVASKH